jgi:hypothetical protein
LSLGLLEIDHFIPQKRDHSLSRDYDNLIYSCKTCNAAKGGRLVPNPSSTFTAESVRVHEDGRIEAQTVEAKRLILLLGLDDDEYREFRRRMLAIAWELQTNNRTLFVELMGFPDDLPDLSRLRPPLNTRPDGIRHSFFEERRSGMKPEVY